MYMSDLHIDSSDFIHTLVNLCISYQAQQHPGMKRMHYLNKSTTYKVSKHLKNFIVHVEELTFNEAMKVRHCLCRKIKFGRCRVVRRFKNYR